MRYFIEESKFILFSFLFYFINLGYIADIYCKEKGGLRCVHVFHLRLRIIILEGVWI